MRGKSRFSIRHGIQPEPSAALRDSLKAKPTDFIFPNRRGGFIYSENFLKRVLKPVRDALGLKKLNFQVLRRSFATNAQDQGSVKSIQRQLRHTKETTTMRNYIKPLDDSVRTLVESMYSKLQDETIAAAKALTDKIQ